MASDTLGNSFFNAFVNLTLVNFLLAFTKSKINSFWVLITGAVSFSISFSLIPFLYLNGSLENLSQPIGLFVASNSFSSQTLKLC